MYQAYSDETFEFFMAIAFNNNADFFHANHDWYVRGVRGPSLYLAQRLSDTIEEIDESLERRPDRVVSRINRDLRFSYDKTPYRDYLWLAWRRSGGAEARFGRPAFYFDISTDHAGWGMGIFMHNKPLCNAWRLALLKEPGRIERTLEPLRGSFLFEGECYKRMPAPIALPETLKAFYPIKTLDVFKSTKDFDLVKSDRLGGVISEDFKRLAPLYHILNGLVPVEDDEFKARVQAITDMEKKGTV